jgi:hypothetical protein
MEQNTPLCSDLSQRDMITAILAAERGFLASVICLLLWGWGAENADF